MFVIPEVYFATRVIFGELVTLQNSSVIQSRDAFGPIEFELKYMMDYNCILPHKTTTTTTNLYLNTILFNATDLPVGSCIQLKV